MNFKKIFLSIPLFSLLFAGYVLSDDIESLGTDQDQPVTFETEEYSDAVTCERTITKAPSNGILSTFNGRELTYTPNPGFSGTDEFSLSVKATFEDGAIEEWTRDYAVVVNKTDGETDNREDVGVIPTALKNTAYARSSTTFFTITGQRYPQVHPGDAAVRMAHSMYLGKVSSQKNVDKLVNVQRGR